MILWIVLAGLVLAALVPLLWPLMRPPRRGEDRLGHDLAVYRDQLHELESERTRETIDATEAAEARREIERRILRAADIAQPKPARRHAPAAIAAVVVAVTVPTAAFLLYGALGHPGLPDAPHRQVAAPEPAQAPALEQMVGQLTTRLDKAPDDVEGWRLLGRTQWELRHYAEAAAAYARAVELDGDNPALLTAYGEALATSADGLVTPPALAVFERAHELDAKQTGARFYLALADQQAGRPQYAYDGWLALARDLPASSPAWRAVVGRLQAVADELGIDLAADLPAVNEAAKPAPGPSQADVEAAANMSAEDRQAFIRTMVDRLADRLAKNPDDFDGWMRLGRAFGVLGEHAKAGEAYGKAAALHPGEADPLAFRAAALLQGTEPGQVPDEPALQALRDLLAVAPDNPRALWYLGLDDVHAGRRAAAVEKWEKLRDQLAPGSKERQNLDAAIARLKSPE